jgi:hypothetical protein
MEFLTGRVCLVSANPRTWAAVQFTRRTSARYILGILLLTASSDAGAFISQQKIIGRYRELHEVVPAAAYILLPSSQLRRASRRATVLNCTW